MSSSLFSLTTTMSSLLFLQISFLTLFIAMTIASSPTTCPKTCGKVPIPPPFGIGPRCSKIRNIELTCDHSSKPPTLWFMNTKLPILSTMNTTHPTSILHIDRISRTVTMPCTTNAAYKKSYETICPYFDGCVHGYGCCNTTWVEVKDKGRYKWRFCFKEIHGTRIHVANFTSSNSHTCQEAQEAGGGGAVCGANAKCVNLIYGAYGCVCYRGYEGNPFQGCRDIDECILYEDNPCARNAICHNLRGGYNCSCIENYEGDGLKDGSGCIMRHLKIYIALGSAAIAVLGLLSRDIFLPHLLKLMRTVIAEIRRRQRRERQHQD